jgi:hypothetical protein
MASNLDIFADAAGTMPSMSQQSGEPSKQGDESTTSTADSVSSTSACGEFPSVARIKSAFPSHKIKKHVLVSAQPPRPQMSSIDPARRHQQEQYELAFNQQQQQQQQHHRQLQLETGQHQQHQPECNGQLGLIDEEEGPVNTGLRYYHDGNGDVREYIDEHSEPSLPDREL